MSFPRLVMLFTILLPVVVGGSNSTTTLEAENLEKAAVTARTENKHMLVAFLGDGWSVRCKRFESQVLDTPAFKAFSEDWLVYFPVEARRQPKLTSEETAVLQSWVIHFDIKAYPTLILLAPDGQELLRHGYRDVSAGEYIGLLQAILPAKTSSE